MVNKIRRMFRRIQEKHERKVKWDGSKWSMMAVGLYDDKYVLAFRFNKREVADDFYNTISSWNNNEPINDNNINISLVLEDKDNYSVHVHLMNRFTAILGML